MFTPYKPYGQRLSIYYPAVTITTQDIVGDQTFFRPHSIIGQYPYVLFSAGLYYKSKNLRFDNKIIESEISVFGDSGGYQILKDQKYEQILSDKISLEWCTNNSDVFPILDRPLRDYTQEEHCRMKTKQAAIHYVHNKPKDKIVLNVASGNDIEKFTKWYKDIIYPYTDIFDGICHGQSRGRIDVIFQFFFYLLHKKVFDNSEKSYHYHIFGVGNNTVALYLMVLQKLLNDRRMNIQVTYDTSSPFLKSNCYGQMIVEDGVRGFRNFQIFQHYDQLNQKKINVLPCSCPICTKINEYNEKQYYFAFGLHNLKMILDWKHKYEFFIHNPTADAMEFANQYDKSLYHNMNVIIKCFNNPGNATHIINNDWKPIDKAEYLVNDHLLLLKKAEQIKAKSDGECMFVVNVDFEKELERIMKSKNYKFISKVDGCEYDVMVASPKTALIPGQFFIDAAN